MRDLQKDLDWALSKTELPVVLVHALERAIKAEALNRELIEVLQNVANQCCYTKESGDYDSMGISAYAELLETLCEQESGGLEFVRGFGRRVIAKVREGLG